MEIYQIQMEELLDLELLVIKISVINKNIIKNLEIVFQTIRFLLWIELMQLMFLFILMI